MKGRHLVEWCLIVAGLGLLLAHPLVSSAQGERWYFGRGAGLRIEASGTPSSLTDAPTTYNCAEGGATATDAQGRLLFYTDGDRLYNRLHQVIPGSAGMGGHVSSSQSSVVFRVPGSSTHWYVVTSDAIESFPGSHRGVRYTEVDMTLNGGLGGVTSRHSMALRSGMSEKLTAVRHANGQDVWVIAHGMDNAEFVAWRATTAGIGLIAPTISAAGTPHRAAGAGNYNPGRGCMKVSPSGDRLVAVVMPPIGGRWVAELFSFDPATGRVSFLEDLGESAAGQVGYNYYGVEFSPSGAKVYVSCRLPPYRILQFDLCAPAGQIAATRTVVATTLQEPGTLGLGPDGRIYCARNSSTSLGVIGSPERAGTACQWQDQGVSLTGRTSTFGLSNGDQTTLFRLSHQIAAQAGCLGAPSQFSASAEGCFTFPAAQLGYEWSFADPGSGASNQASGAQVTHVYRQPGTYRVRLIVTARGRRDTLFHTLAISPTPQPTLSMPGGGSVCQGPRTLTLSLPAGATLAGHRFTGPDLMLTRTAEGFTASSGAHGTYRLGVWAQNAQGCQSQDTVWMAFRVDQTPLPIPLVDGPVCLGSVLTARVPDPLTPRRWLIGSDTVLAGRTLTHNADRPGSVSLRLLGYEDRAAGRCYTTSEPASVEVRAPELITLLRWDSAFCGDAPEGVYQMANWTQASRARLWVEGGHIMDSGQGRWVVRWDGRLTDGMARLTATPVPGCPSEEVSGMIIERCLDFYNVVTADGDAINPTFLIRNIERYPDNELTIYNRWGRMVAQRRGYYNDLTMTGWPTGTYHYTLRVRVGNSERTHQGWLEVAR